MARAGGARPAVAGVGAVSPEAHGVREHHGHARSFCPSRFSLAALPAGAAAAPGVAFAGAEDDAAPAARLDARGARAAAGAARRCARRAARAVGLAAGGRGIRRGPLRQRDAGSGGRRAGLRAQGARRPAPGGRGHLPRVRRNRPLSCAPRGGRAGYAGCGEQRCLAPTAGARCHRHRQGALLFRRDVPGRRHPAARPPERRLRHRRTLRRGRARFARGGGGVLHRAAAQPVAPGGARGEVCPARRTAGGGAV